MKKSAKIILVLTLILVCVFAFIACNNGDDPAPEDPTKPGTTTPEDPTKPGTTTPEDPTKPTDTMPTAAQVAAAIKAQSESAAQNYDFKLQLSGNINVGLIVTPDAHAIYDGSYRYDPATQTLLFKRTTSGILLYDSTEYIKATGDQTVTVKTDTKNNVKKVAIEAKDDLNLINTPFVNLVSSLEAKNITDISRNGTSGYKAKLSLSANNNLLNLICTALGKMDLSLSLKGVTFTNPVNGLGFEFTMSNNAITGYTLTADVSVPVSTTTVNLNLRYEQTNSTAAIVLPSYASLIIEKSDIADTVNEISSLLTNIKDDAAYSLDVNAVNEMDPAWNKLATKDSYEARFYKNTQKDNTVAFNKSYEYHSHHDEDGRETYKYTVGNVTDGSVYLVTQKMLNKTSEKLADTITADSQFDELTALFDIAAADVDCIKSEVKQTTTTYTVYLSDAAVKNLSDDIVALLNTNDADGVIDVNNYIGSDYTIKDASFTIVVNSGKLTSMEFESEIRYNPTEGEYVEYNITLNNELTLDINKELDKAEDYKTPSKPDGTFSNLDYLL